jgi:hypothetical protein
MYLQYLQCEKLRVPKVLWVSWHTVRFAGWYVPVPATGTVYVGMGAVWETPTRSIPVLNSKGGQSKAS